jgi:hypothetical protein
MIQRSKKLCPPVEEMSFGKQSCAEAQRIGALNEVQIQPHLEKLWGTKLVRAKEKYALIDMESPDKTHFCDVKKRNILHNQYPTALIGKGKCDYLDQYPDAKRYFVYSYKDGVYFIEYKPEVFQSFECRLYKCADRVDDVQTPQPTYFIPVQRLMPLPIELMG